MKLDYRIVLVILVFILIVGVLLWPKGEEGKATEEDNLAKLATSDKVKKAFSEIYGLKRLKSKNLKPSEYIKESFLTETIKAVNKIAPATAIPDPLNILPFGRLKQDGITALYKIDSIVKWSLFVFTWNSHAETKLNSYLTKYLTSAELTNLYKHIKTLKDI